MEQQLFTFPEHMGSPLGFGEDRVAPSLEFSLCLFICLSFLSFFANSISVFFLLTNMKKITLSNHSSACLTKTVLVQPFCQSLLDF